MHKYTRSWAPGRVSFYLIITRGPEDQEARGPGSQEARGPGSQRTWKPEDLEARGPGSQEARGPGSQRICRYFAQKHGVNQFLY